MRPRRIVVGAAFDMSRHDPAEADPQRCEAGPAGTIAGPGDSHVRLNTDRQPTRQALVTTQRRDAAAFRSAQLWSPAWYGRLHMTAVIGLEKSWCTASMRMSSFATLINLKVIVPSARTRYVSIDKDHLIEFLKPALRNIYFDAEWYLRTNPDISQAIENGTIASAQDHYITHGYYEHRMPYEMNVEEKWYLAQYPDVSEAVSKGLFKSAHDHYFTSGYREGRLPYAGFALRVVG
jgi:hypothetical protein